MRVPCCRCWIASTAGALVLALCCWYFWCQYFGVLTLVRVLRAAAAFQRVTWHWQHHCQPSLQPAVVAVCGAAPRAQCAVKQMQWSRYDPLLEGAAFLGFQPMTSLRMRRCVASGPGVALHSHPVKRRGCYWIEVSDKRQGRSDAGTPIARSTWLRMIQGQVPLLAASFDI
jgi:hypothetical protein